MSGAYVYAAVRTPFGKLGGGLANIRPDDLAATVLSGLLAKTPGLDPGAIDEVMWGNANGAGEENRNVGRMAVLLAGLPTSVPATTVNRLCGSSLDAAMIASRTIETGDADITVAGGVGVDDPRTMGAAQAVPPVPAGKPGGGLDNVGLALGQ
jgi:acetyl-CoA acetyltransferase